MVNETDATMDTFGFDPIHRYQTESDFRLVWNALLNWNDLPKNPPAATTTPAR